MRAILFVLLALVSNPSWTQWSLAAVGGVGIGRIRTDLYPLTSRGEGQVIDHRFSWAVGARMQHALSGPFRFGTGLRWSCFNGHEEYWSQAKKIQENDRQAHYLYLPLVLSVELAGIRIGAGYQFGIPVVQSGTFRTYPYANGSGQTSSYETTGLGLMPTDFGVLGELEYRFTDRIGGGLCYYMGLQDVKDHDDGFRSPLWNEQALFTISYLILPRSKQKKEKEPPAEKPIVPEEQK